MDYQPEMNRTETWTDLRCPNCRRWLAKLSGDLPVGLKIVLKCSTCKHEIIFPATGLKKRVDELNGWEKPQGSDTSATGT